MPTCLMTCKPPQSRITECVFWVFSSLLFNVELFRYDYQYHTEYHQASTSYTEIRPEHPRFYLLTMLSLAAMSLFATSASAQLATSMWGFAVPKFLNRTYSGSVMNLDADRTTVAYTADDMKSSGTITLGGITYFGYTATPNVSGRTSATFVVTCSRANEEVVSATCLQSQLGAESKIAANCASRYSGAELSTLLVPEWCTNSAAFEEAAKRPMTISSAEMANYALVLTAGLEKLSATATGPSKTNAEGTPLPTGSAVATGAAASLQVPLIAAVVAVVSLALY